VERTADGTQERTLSLANLYTKRQWIAELARSKRGVALVHATRTALSDRSRHRTYFEVDFALPPSRLSWQTSHGWWHVHCYAAVSEALP